MKFFSVKYPVFHPLQLKVQHPREAIKLDLQHPIQPLPKTKWRMRNMNQLVRLDDWERRSEHVRTGARKEH